MTLTIRTDTLRREALRFRCLCRPSTGQRGTGNKLQNGELFIECKEVQFRRFLIVSIREEVDISPVGLKPAQSQRDQAGRRASGAEGVTLSTHTLHWNTEIPFQTGDAERQEAVEFSRTPTRTYRNHCDEPTWRAILLNVRERGNWKRWTLLNVVNNLSGKENFDKYSLRSFGKRCTLYST